MNRIGRLDTETLIQECRNGFDTSKYRERAQELELTLELRNKELQILTVQLTECKQEASMKLLTLEETIGKLQREIADMRITVIKTKRAESERAEKQIRIVRQQCQKRLQDQQQQFLKNFQVQEEKFKEKLSRAEDKTQQFTQFSKEENSVLKSLKQQKYASIQAYSKSLETEKDELLISRRDAERRLHAMKQVYDKMKVEYEVSLNNKEQAIIQLNGQLESLKLKERFLSQSLQEERHNFSQFRINSKYDQEQLLSANQRILKDKQQLAELLQSKNDQLLQIIGMGDKSASGKIILPPTQNCEHIGLIKQLERSLELKEAELKQLRAIVDEWSEQIGFKQPLRTRYQKLLNIAQRAQKLKVNQFKVLKDKTRSINGGQKIK